MRSFVLACTSLLVPSLFACATNSDSIAGDVHLNDDDDDSGGSTSGGRKGGTTSGGSSSGGGTSSGVEPGSSSSSGGGSSSGGAPSDVLGPTYEGESTYYNVELDDLGNCSLPTPSTYLVAALNTADYDGSALCGGCIEVTGPAGTTVVQVWDRCPGCGVHGVDLSETAFKAVSPLSAGRIDVSWRTVRCPVSDGLEYQVFADRIQIRNTRVPVESVEVDGDLLTRRSDNFFLGAMPTGSFTVRVTGSTGEVVEEAVPGRGSYQGMGQFP